MALGRAYCTPIGEDPAAHGHWCTFTDLCHTIPCYTMPYPTKTRTAPGMSALTAKHRVGLVDMFHPYTYMCTAQHDRSQGHTDCTWSVCPSCAASRSLSVRAARCLRLFSVKRMASSASSAEWVRGVHCVQRAVPATLITHAQMTQPPVLRITAMLCVRSAALISHVHAINIGFARACMVCTIMARMHECRHEWCALLQSLQLDSSWAVDHAAQVLAQAHRRTHLAWRSGHHTCIARAGARQTQRSWTGCCRVQSNWSPRPLMPHALGRWRF